MCQGASPLRSTRSTRAANCLSASRKITRGGGEGHGWPATPISLFSLTDQSKKTRSMDALPRNKGDGIGGFANERARFAERLMTTATRRAVDESSSKDAEDRDNRAASVSDDNGQRGGLAVTAGRGSRNPRS